MKVAVQRTHPWSDSQVDRKHLEDARNDTAILAAHPAKEELSDSFGLFWLDGHDIRHSSPLSEDRTRRTVYLEWKPVKTIRYCFAAASYSARNWLG